MIQSSVILELVIETELILLSLSSQQLRTVPAKHYTSCQMVVSAGKQISYRSDKETGRKHTGHSMSNQHKKMTTPLDFPQIW